MKLWKLATVSTVLLASSSANAALIERLGGRAAYDTDLDITWLTNSSDGMGWADAKVWAAGLFIDGYAGWRLPTTFTVDSSCTADTAGTLSAAGGTANGYNCIGSELGHLFYNELGGTAGNNIHSSTDPDAALFSIDPSGLVLWSNTPDASNPNNNAYYYNFSNGEQGISYNGAGYSALAVRDGDISAVPVPAAAWLFGSGLIGLAGVARRKEA